MSTASGSGIVTIENRAQVHEKDDVRQRDERDFLDERVTQRVHRLLDQIRPVVEGHDRHAGGKPGLDLGDAGLDRIDDLLGVDARCARRRPRRLPPSCP